MVARILCANTKPGQPCGKPGALACKNCLLVAYCGSDCQKAHWYNHKEDCKSPLGKDSWKPGWVREGRWPSFVESPELWRTPSSGSSSGPRELVGIGNRILFGTVKYLWGNVPALDVIQLAKNEGEDCGLPLNLLFAASGDLRNVLMSLANLPEAYEWDVNVVLNDRDFSVVARNAILLLIFLTIEDPLKAAECAIHVFYSVLVSKTCYKMLRKEVRPLVKRVCDNIADKAPGALLGKTWIFGERDDQTLRLVLSKTQWFELLSFFDVPEGLNKAAAIEVRAAVTNAPSRVDYLHRHLLYKKPKERIAFAKFRAEGLLLPFSYQRTDFEVPNPTLFQKADEWPMLDDADPIAGWDLKTVMATKTGPAANDIYGKLYYYLKDLFTAFHKQVFVRPVSFTLHHTDARLLPKHIQDNMKFDRIETSNIADTGYLGLKVTLNTLAPLLQSDAENPHATLLTCFLNAVPETIDAVEGNSPPTAEDVRNITRNVMLYSGPSTADVLHGRHEDPQTLILRCLDGRGILRDNDMFFNKYMDTFDFATTGIEAGLYMKDSHTIVDKWPLRFVPGPATAEKRRQFQELCSSFHTGQERYVEWRSAGSGEAEEVD